jgi:hypothetical protein
MKQNKLGLPSTYHLIAEFEWPACLARVAPVRRVRAGVFAAPLGNLVHARGGPRPSANAAAAQPIIHFRPDRFLQSFE